MIKKYTTCSIQGEWDDINNFQSLFPLRVPRHPFYQSAWFKCLTSFALTGPVGSTTHRAVCFTLIQLMRHRFVLD